MMVVLLFRDGSTQGAELTPDGSGPPFGVENPPDSIAMPRRVYESGRKHTYSERDLGTQAVTFNRVEGTHWLFEEVGDG